jgi:hypothetical protein
VWATPAAFIFAQARVGAPITSFKQPTKMIPDRGELIRPEEQEALLNWICPRLWNLNTLRPSLIEYTFDVSDAAVPPAFWAIRRRLMEREGLAAFDASYSNAFFRRYQAGAPGVYRDYIAIILPGGNINPHTDMNQPGRIHSRFNVFLKAPTRGGATFYGGEPVEIKERGYVLCRSGLDEHWAEKIGPGSPPRITLSFGFQLPLELLNQLSRPPVPLETMKAKLLRLLGMDFNSLLSRRDGQRRAYK